jgi:glycosyltransferase involved in cell wall biosynthesis
MSIVIIIIYLFSMTLIMIFSLVQFDLSLRYIRMRKKKKGATLPQADLTDYPFITVQLPVYNEKYVIRRLLDSVTELDYPEDRYEIQVLDDSTDETSQIIQDYIRESTGKKLRIEYLHRKDRDGYKAGALLEGLKKASGDFITIFDADFIPEKEDKGTKLIFASSKKRPNVEYKMRVKSKTMTGHLDLAGFIDVKGWKATGNKFSEYKIKVSKELVTKPETGQQTLDSGDTIEF